MSDPTYPRTFVLRDLPLAARLTLAVFLVSVGIGYVSALVQVHFQHARPGEFLPTPENLEPIYHGGSAKPMSKIERLITADEKETFNGTGQMSAAFTSSSSNWEQAVSDRADLLAPNRKEQGDELLAVAEQDLRKEREGERLAMVAWLHSAARKSEYTRDAFPLPPSFGNQPITEKYLANKDRQPSEKPVVKIRTLLKDRCVRCHREESTSKAKDYPLDTFEHLKESITVQASSAMSLNKLAQTTHVHLLGFAMLYGLTGMVLAFSSYPRLVRIVLCPLPLAAQVTEISLWWLARMEAPHGPLLARAIVTAGGLVGASLFLHIVLSLFNLFSWRGKLILIVLAGTAAVGGYFVYDKVVDPYLKEEAKRAAAAVAE